MLAFKVLAHPLNKVVLEHPLDELIDIGVWEVFCERLGGDEYWVINCAS